MLLVLLVRDRKKSNFWHHTSIPLFGIPHSHSHPKFRTQVQGRVQKNANKKNQEATFTYDDFSRVFLCLSVPIFSIVF
jgi:hypothetical protein